MTNPTPEELAEAIRQSLWEADDRFGISNRHGGVVLHDWDIAVIAAAIRETIEAEREACAKICEKFADTEGPFYAHSAEKAASYLAESIRARCAK